MLVVKNLKNGLHLKGKIDKDIKQTLKLLEIYNDLQNY